MTVIELPDERPISWNKLYAGVHWRKRKAEADRVHMVVRSALDPESTPYTVPVSIAVEARFAHHPLDCCNVPAKLYIDGLLGWLIEDDDPRYVSSVTTTSLVDKESPGVRIIVSPIPQ